MTVLVAQHSQLQTNAPNLIRARWDYVLVIYILTGLTGIAQSVGSQSELVSLLTAVLYASATTRWAIVDSRLSGRSLLRIKQELFFFTWPLASLVYLIETRKLRGLGLWLLNVFALYATLYLTFYSTLVVVNWIRG